MWRRFFGSASASALPLDGGPRVLWYGAMSTAVEEHAFLRPILAAFADDDPRHIYADYLDESHRPGDIARAEFIRLQLELARIDGDHPRRGPLLRRVNQLLIRWQPEWVGPLRGMIAGCEFRRGLLDTVSVDARFFCESGDRLFEGTAVRRVKFLDAERILDRFVRCPALGRVRELDLCGNDLGNGGVNLLLRSPFLAQLESLDLSFNGIGDGGAEMLANARPLARLMALQLNDNRTIGCAGMKSLARSPHLGHLRTLDVSGNDVADAGLIHLSESAGLRRLRTVRLHANRIGDAGVAAFAESELFARILKHSAKLDLRENGIGPAGAKAIANAPAMELTHSLDLGGNLLRDDGAIALAESDRLGRLRILSLRQNRIGDLGARSLAHSDLMAHLAKIDVSSNRITPRAIELLWANRKDFQTALESLGQFCFSTAQSP